LRSFTIGLAIFLVAGLGCQACSSSRGNKGRPPADGDSLGDALAQTDVGRDDLGPPGLSRCVNGWPKGPETHVAARPSLDVDAPRLLWAAKGQGSSVGGIARAGSRIAVALGDGIAFVDKAGSVTKYHGGSMGFRASEVTADEQGNVYFPSAAGVYSLNAEGQRRWSMPYASASPDGSAMPGAFALSPDGVLYGVTSDGVLRAILAKDGSQVWERPMDMWHHLVANVVGGAGDVVFAGAAGGSGVLAFDSKTGELLGRLAQTNGNNVSAYSGTWALGWDFGIVTGYAFDFDPCGKWRWQTWSPDRPNKATYHGVISLGENLVGSDFETDDGGRLLGKPTLSLYTVDGRAKIGPLLRDGLPFLAGADGTIYTVHCQYLPPGTPAGTNQLVAYGADLSELWRLDLGGGCPSGNGILDADGVLYLARGDESGQNLLAIQTRSPGLADSSWPSLRHDNRGTAWLVPGVPGGTGPTP
jgi:outer membrane protein assembly factor BamB